MLVNSTQTRLAEQLRCFEGALYMAAYIPVPLVVSGLGNPLVFKRTLVKLGEAPFDPGGLICGLQTNSGSPDLSQWKGLGLQGEEWKSEA